MTQMLFQTDSYLQEFDAEVIAVDHATRAVMLDRTAFYPGGGGQPFDVGSLSVGDWSSPVTKVYKNTEGIWHVLGGDQPLPEADSRVIGKIDWSRRYALMRTHTAMHILCGVVFRDYGAQVTGGDMEPLKGRMDFEFETLTKDLIHVIEESVNQEVSAGHAVKIQIMSREKAFMIPDLIRTKINLLPPGIEQIRVVELDGLDLQADGGTHVQSTSEVGQIRVVDYKSKGKINKRIYIELS